jgi:ABC-type multidrug transport system ATPase subunit/pSer/pThr/pTyr-binding forkhead associated (FHA) protein
MQLGKELVAIGSAPDNDVILPGSAPHHARIVRQQGQLFFIDNGEGPTTANGSPIAPQQPVPFDFRTQFVLGQTPLPLAHPAIGMMLMAPGHAQAPRGHVIIGRDAARATLVIAHGAVSGMHATVMMDRMMVVDHGSTSGTYVSGRQVAANEPAPLDPKGVLAFGPVPVPVATLVQFAQAAIAGSVQSATAPLGGTSAVPPLGMSQLVPPNASLGASQPIAPNPGFGASQPIPAPGALGASQLLGGNAPEGSGQQAPRKHRTIIGELSMEQLASSVISIGRTPDNKIVVPHPQVSSKHAQIVKQGAQLFLEDLRSANGTFVRGQRVPPGQRVQVANGEKVFIGPMPLLIHIQDQQINIVVEDAANWAGKPLYEIEAWDLFLHVPDRDNKAEMKVLLDHVSFKALPGDMIALMGPSGAGKTTLLLTLNGYMPPTSGQVRINGEDLYAIYDALRGSIGYVPQDDIVHPELTVFEAVKYSARFRLPPDYSEEEIDRRVDETLRDLGLEGVRNLEIGKPEKKVLSGGQRKRVNIALELVTDPVILFLDEPTSGLAADDTTALINLLSDLTRKTGKTIIMTIHQPAKDEFEKFNLAFIMGYGGIPTYFGPSGDNAYRFFQTIQGRPGFTAAQKVIDNPRDMFDMLNVRERGVLEAMKRDNPNTPRNIARLEAARQWRGEFFQPQNPLYQRMFSGRRAVGAAPAAAGVPRRAGVAIVRQLLLLLSRYWKVKIRDRAGAAIMFLQAPIIGLMLTLVFGGQKESVPFWCLGALQELSKRNASGGTASANLLNEMTPTTDHTAAMFFVVVSCVWFGTSNAAREIVTERAIYLRERMVNLSLFNYVMSKFLLLAMVCVAQCAMLLGIVFFTLGFNGGPVAFLLELVNMIVLAINATALGLLLSTAVASAEAAMALTPIALIPQVVLGGLMVPMTTNPNLQYLMYVMPARWGFQGSIAHERAAIAPLQAWNIDLHDPKLSSAPDFIDAGKFKCATAQIASDSLAGAWGFTQWDTYWVPSAVLGGMTVGMLLILLILLKRRDPV